MQLTYHYEPIVYTSSPPGQQLRDGVVFCKVESWIVRPHLVSLPFSDHAEPLVSNQATLTGLLAFLEEGTREGKWASVELRPPLPPQTFRDWDHFADGQQFLLHQLDLEPGLDDLFHHLNKDSTQRKIRRAAREGLRFEAGRSLSHLQNFFKLSVMTRRRQSLPPPPFEWFRNLADCLGERANIRIAVTRNGELAGAIFTLGFKGTVVFKYGASDARYHNLGTVPALLWQAIEEAKVSGRTLFDFGRSEIGNLGLIRFKDHFGGSQLRLTHKVFPAPSRKPGTVDWKMSLAKGIFSRLPEPALVRLGRLLYPHMG